MEVIFRYVYLNSVKGAVAAKGVEINRFRRALRVEGGVRDLAGFEDASRKQNHSSRHQKRQHLLRE